MTKERVNKSEIRKEAKKLLKQGTSKQVTFELLTEKFKYSKDVADTLKNIPSSQALAKYGIWNHILLGILIITVVIFFILAPSTSSIGMLLWYGVVIYGVAEKRINYYSMVAFLSIIILIGSIVAIFYYSYETISWPIVIGLLVLLTPSCILPYWLEKKLCPKPIERKEQYTNSKGELKLKIVYEFPD